MRKILIFALVLASALGCRAQLLWKVSGNGLREPSYVFGTLHVAPLSVVDSVPELKRVVSATRQTYGEVSAADMERSMQQMAVAMSLSGGVTLRDLLDTREVAVVDSVMRRTLGAGLDNPAMLRMKPAAITAQLTVALYREFVDGYNPDEQLDLWFQEQASEAGKPVGGLESVGDQLDAMFGASLERQAEQLACLAGDMAANGALARLTVEAYMAQDLDALAGVMDAGLGDACDSTEEEEEILIYRRNAAWMKRMPAIMADAPTLFVVGAGHLPGERGLLSLLRKSGYTVEGITGKKHE